MSHFRHDRVLIHEITTGKFRCFCNIIIGILKYEIPYHNKSRRELIKYQKIKLDREKEEAQKADKLTGN